MQISTPNEYGCLVDYSEETVAQVGRSTAAVRIARCEDGTYRKAVSLMYSYGGFGGPVCVESQSYPNHIEARDAGLQELLARWYTPVASDPACVHEELRQLRQQICDVLRQPNLF